jgi:hypothetical protein
MKNLTVTVAVCVFVWMGGCDAANLDNDSTIKDAILNGEIVKLSDVDSEGLSEVSINGIAIGTIHQAITIGCFEIPTCVRINELGGRSIVRLTTDDFAIYEEESASEPPTGVLYFSTLFYSPYFYTNGNYHAHRALVDAHGDGEYTGKRLGYCLGVGNPHCAEAD